MLNFVLASQSPRRKKLLTQLGLIFEIIPSKCEEIITSEIPHDIVTDLALQKAEDVAPKVANSLIIGADTIVVCNDEILGKPRDKEDAFTMLKKLSGTSHQVFTGVSFVRTDGQSTVIEKKAFYEETKVWFSSLSDSEIKSYIDTGSPMDKAGAYGIQDDWGAVFIERIDGDYYNVVGFPLNRVYRELKKMDLTFINPVAIQA